MAHKIVVVDDDPVVGTLTKELLLEAGYEVQLISDSLQALDAVKRESPILVVLDIIMPGLDGLTLCRQLKNDPQTKDIRVVMVSGKAFHADRQRAKDYGAELFIEKPYNVEKFAQQVKDLVASAAPSPEAAGPKPVELGPPPGTAGTVMTATVWGCRSLSPEKRGERSKYGRATSCVSLEVGGELLIFDAGSGLNALSAQLQKDGRYKTLWLFLTHFHQDHVEGLGGFSCLRAPGFTLNIGGINDPDKSLADKVAEVFDAAPGKYGPVSAPIELYEMTEDTYEILPGIQVTSFFANHPGMTLGFMVESGERKFVYCPDSELYGERGTALQDYDEELGKICAGADLLIHDARYTEEDYRTRLDNGHSSWRSAVEFAGRNKIKRLVLTHHDDQYSDAVIDSVAAAAARLVAEKGYSLELAMAAEGLKIGI
jgi:CheY-like chemotaxis protein